MRNFIRQSIVILIVLCIIGIGLFYSLRKGTGVYSGGEGTVEDPYRIATVADLIALGNEPHDYGKHFILCAPIDLSDYIFDQALIAPDEDDRDARYQGIGFSGSFDGNGYTIGSLCIKGTGCLGLFGVLNPGSVVENLGLIAVDVNGTEDYVGGVVAYNEGQVSACYVIGLVTGRKDYVGGLVGSNRGDVSNCYSMSTVVGDDYVGSLVGDNAGIVAHSYSIGAVTADRYGGGLVGYNYYGSVWNCFWDIQISGCRYSDGGVGLTTQEMMDPQWIGLQGWGRNPNWILDPGQDYPRLAWQFTPGTMVPEPRIEGFAGTGSPEDPYQLSSVDQLSLINKASLLWQDHYVLVRDLDMTGTIWDRAVIPEFSGRFHGNGCCIRNLIIKGHNYVGFFGRLAPATVVTDLGLEVVDVNGTGEYVGGLAGRSSGSIENCYSNGVMTGEGYVAGLVGENFNGMIENCHSSGVITGDVHVGGLVGSNDGDIRNSYSIGTVTGSWYIGGLLGENVYGMVSTCYSTGAVTGTGDYAGGLLGFNADGTVVCCYSRVDVTGNCYAAGLVGYNRGSISTCYSTGKVTATGSPVGGLAGTNAGSISKSLWDMNSSAQQTSQGGEGVHMAQMQDFHTYLDQGWDFVGETANGMEDIWRMPENDYPVHAWNNGLME